MTKNGSVKVFRDPPKRKLSDLVADSNRNAEPENQSVPKRRLSKHGMQLRPRSASVSPESPRKKKKPSPKKDSPSPVIKRPESPEEARSSEGMYLRPKRKSLEQQPPPTTEKAQDCAAPKPVSYPQVPKDYFQTLPPKYEGDDPEEMQRNEKERRERREWREARQFLYVDFIVDRSIWPTGFTHRELDHCRPFLMKNDFEMKGGPIPEDKKYYKEVLDQVRATKGYGVTIRYPGGIVLKSFIPLKADLEKNEPQIVEFAEIMTNQLLRAMKRKRKLTYTSAGVENFVRSTARIYFLTLRVNHTGPATPPQVVEAMFAHPPGGAKKFNLLEWKIKEGWGTAYLTREFFHNLASKLGDDLLLVVAEEDDKPVAGALNLIGGNALYGRLWGCLPEAYYPSLHFVACYYQAAIEMKLARVEAGAQGEHKIQRGYLPVTTYSCHYIQDEEFRHVIGDFVVHEAAQVKLAIKLLSEGGPFKEVVK